MGKCLYLPIKVRTSTEGTRGREGQVVAEGGIVLGEAGELEVVF